MTISAISGTILAVEKTGEQTILHVETGGNGSKREENVILPGRREVASGKAVRLVNFIRATDGSLVPGENATLKVSTISTEAPTTHHEPAPTSAPVNSDPPPAQLAPPAPMAALAKQTTQPIGLMAFSNRTTRRAIFNRTVDVAREFEEHIRKSGQIIKIQGRDYVTVAGWSLLPAFESANCYTVSHSIQPDGTVIAEAIVEKDGHMVSRGFGACSEKDRPKINDRLAMAQTRARGSALKARYSVLVTLAGYEASLADEVEAAIDHPRPAKTQVQHASAQPTAPAQKPTPKQVTFALSIFDNDKSALLQEVARTGLLVFNVEDVPVSILKAIVERRVTERKNQRAESAARAA